MESKIKKQRKKAFLFSILGYFLGAGLYDFIAGDKDILRFLSGTLFAAVANVLLVSYEHWKYPNMKEKKKLLDEDERNIFITGKAAYSSLLITGFTLVVIFLISLVIENKLISYFSMILYLYIFLLLIISKVYYDKRI